MGVSHTAALGRSTWFGELAGRGSRAVLRPRSRFLPLLVLLPALVFRGKVPAGTYLQFVAGAAVFFGLPGLAIARACGLRCKPLELSALVLALGLAASSVVFVGAAACKQPWAYALLPLASAYVLLHHWRRNASRAGVERCSPGISVALALVISVVIAVMMVSPVHGVDFMRDGAGVKLVGWPDGTLHSAITNELSHTFPPKNPLLGDHGLAYHYASELSAVVFVKFLGLPATTVCLRLLPALFLALAVLSFAALVEQLTGSVHAALLTPLLVLLGEDLSYVLDWWRGTGGAAAGDYFRSPSVFGLYFANPNLPALAVFGCATLGFGRALRHGRHRLVWLAVTGALLGLSGAYKIFFGLQTLAALAALLLLGRRYRFRVAQLLAATLVALMVFQAPWLLAHRDERVIAVVPTFFTGWIPSMIGSLGLTSSPWLATAVSMFEQERITGLGLAQWLGVALPLFVVGTLGIRVAGLPLAVRALRTPNSGPRVMPFLAAFVACGYILGLGLRITPLDYPDDYNNSVWFVVESKLVSSVFVGVAFGIWFRSWSPHGAAWVVALHTLALAAPGTVSTLAKLRASSATVIATSDELRVAEYLGRHAPSGAIVLCENGNVRRLLLAETRLRVPEAPEFYPTSFLRRASLDERQRDLRDFWQSWRAGTVRRDLARKYRLDYVVAARPLSELAAAFRAGDAFVYQVAEIEGVAAAPLP